MFRILIVDDEPYVVNGLFEFIKEIDHLELDVFKAYSINEALHTLDTMRIDIVLSDIRMPGMSGLELHKEIIQRWPSCKMIFLTGFDEFDYIQQAVRNGSVVDFVLKIEEDDRVLKAIEKAISEIQSQLSNRQKLQKAMYSAKQAIPLLQNQLVSDLLHGEQTGHSGLEKKLADLNIPLLLNRPVHLVIGRVDLWPDGYRDSDKRLLKYAIQNIAEETFLNQAVFFHYDYDQAHFVWFLQACPKSTASPGASAQQPEELRRFILGTLETVQSHCHDFLKLTISLIVSEGAFEWDQLETGFHSLKWMLDYGVGCQTEMALIDAQNVRWMESETSSEQVDSRHSIRRTIQCVSQLETYLDNAQSTHFFEILQQIGERAEGYSHAVKLELFYSMTTMYLSYVNRKGMISQLAGMMDLEKLIQMEKHPGWTAMIAYFRDVAEKLFSIRVQEQDRYKDNIVDKIHLCINENMSGDLSLTRLAAVVHLNPFYLSRLYKQITGNSLSNYITEVRMTRARELLLSTDKKIHEISLEVGYDYAPYFTRYFKKLYQLTPQEFRNRGK